MRLGKWARHRRVRPLLCGLAWGSIACSGLGLAQAAGLHVLLNLTPSLPRGLYLVRPLGTLTPGTLVVLQPETALQPLLGDRHYLPPGLPLLKPVAAVAGDTVCVEEDVRVNGQVLTTVIAATDTQGRPLPQWRGCRVLEDEVFLLSTWHPRSLDSRYYGPVHASRLQGRAIPVWTWE